MAADHLPITKFEDKIVETVKANPVVVIIGETGSGKSTQLSQILHRRGYTRSGSIAVTQPRRVAAVSVARRVALELGVRLGDEVGYSIRFEDQSSEKTRIKYLTDGCLLREILSNPELHQYSVIILDEAHERSLNTVDVWPKVYMTIGASYAFSNIEEIWCFFISRVKWDKSHEAKFLGIIPYAVCQRIWLVSDILLGLMKRLVKMRSSNLKVLITSATLDGVKVSRFFSDCPILNVPGTLFPVEKLYSAKRPASYLDSSLQTALDIHIREPPGDVLIFMTGQDDIEKMVAKLEERIGHLEEGSCLDAIVYPLHGSLPPEAQVLVFSPAPPNCRRFIVATNIAETSLTIDGIVYVIDCGYVKQRQYNPTTGIYSLDTVQISRVQADQRAGRAGRTRPGKCYRLYPSSVYLEELLDATVPEILRSSLAGCVLYLKSLDLTDIDILKFDFLDPPSDDSLEDALRQLYLIDAIDENGLITDIGRKMAELPLDPSLSRTLIEANELGCLSQALTVAAMLSVETTFLHNRRKDKDKKRKQPVSDLPNGSGWGDHIQLLQIYENWAEAGYDRNWLIDNDLQVRSMKFAKDIRKQLCQIMQKIAKGAVDVQSNHRHKESRLQYHGLRKALCQGYGNLLAERMIHHNGYRTLGHRSQLVQVHPSSVLESDEDGRLPDYVVYHELVATSRPFMRNVCAVEMAWVMPILKKLEKLDINKLSGGMRANRVPEFNGNPQTESSKNEAPESVKEPDNHDSKIQAARERYLARKGRK